MLLLKVLAVLSLLAVGCYGHSRPSKWTTGHNKAPPGYYDRPAKINYVSEAKYRKVPCYFTTTPPDNKVYHYYTIVYWAFYYRCYAFKLQTQTLHPNDNQGKQEYNFMSPGYDSSSSSSYPSRRLSYYHIKCDQGHRIQFDVHSFVLQDRIRVSYNERKCVDYVKILDLNDRKNHEEFCGTHEPKKKLSNNTYSNNVLVTFRSSQYNNYKGFFLRATCIRQNLNSMENCLKVEEVEYATDKRTKIVPKYALTELQTFLRSREQGVWMMSDDEAVWNADILSLAVLSEHSCDAEYKRAGKAVLKQFPQWMVKKEREDYKKDAGLYV